MFDADRQGWNGAVFSWGSDSCDSQSRTLGSGANGAGVHQSRKMGRTSRTLEIAAAKRWLSQHAETYRSMAITVLGDDLQKSPTVL